MFHPSFELFRINMDARYSHLTLHILMIHKSQRTVLMDAHRSWLRRCFPLRTFLSFSEAFGRTLFIFRIRYLQVDIRRYKLLNRVMAFLW